MITIETIDTYVSPTEKPEDRVKPVVVRKELRFVDRMATWVNSQHSRMLEAAHHARLVKSARKGDLPVDVQRYVESLKTDTQTLVERYVNRLV